MKVVLILMCFSFLFGCGTQSPGSTPSPQEQVWKESCLEEHLRFKSDPLEDKKDFFDRLKADFEDCLADEEGVTYMKTLTDHNLNFFENWN